jgi:8-oxo-dGTP diphosphatase
MVTFATLAYLQHQDKILLQRKAPGLFGEGRWNAPGGKLLPGEPPEEGAAREMQEETGLRVSGLRFQGILNFYLGESKVLDQTVFLFMCKKFKGRLRRSAEGELRWFPIGALPYDEMWQDDRIWLPLFLKGKNFLGDFYFTENYVSFVNHEIHEVSQPV